ncbi:MAG TPA: alpha/beta fold hydrolase, partial [Nocardioides sp.]|nr:alpha/beta fold hydrolase [Nocardioides sp.]
MHPVVSRPEAATRPTTYRFVRDLAQCQALDVAVGDPGTRRMRPIEHIDVPTRIVWSGGDRVLTGHWAQQGYDALPATVETMPGVGHLPMLDDPAAVAGLIRRQVGAAAVSCDRHTAE